eukprot:GHRR01004959.1.p1 GENE.GHRR01004959.1~~GHRR01004959.1.p1  ORF type:complete len:282 (+),score=121.16 GHRR01004959.1:1188-2033(+)
MSKSSKQDSPERENFGWRATSTVPAKKRKLIEGVSGRGVVELQAQLYRAQEHAKLRAEGGVDIRDKHVRRAAGIDVASIKNPGVEAREAHDRQLQLKGQGQGPERLAESSVALQRKAQLYDRLARRDVDDGNQYEVEFWRKGPLHEQEAQQQEELDWLRHDLHHEQHPDAVDTAGAAVSGSGTMMSKDMERELQRREWEQREAALMQQVEEEQQRRAAHRTAVKELSGQTQAGRKEAAAARAQKEEMLAAKRARLKAAFINQQMQAILSKNGKKPAGSAAG